MGRFISRSSILHPPSSVRSRLLGPLPLALAFTLFNAGKPLVIDDTAYVRFAEQIRQHPGDPYGFRMLWYQYAEPAFGILAPPVLPYWIAGAMALFGDNPFLWKLSLFPFVWLFTASLSALFRRFCPGFERPLLAMTVFSPLFLPSLNLMLDVPALALQLGGLACFLRAGDRRRGGWGWVVAAGTLTGLGMQTKYTALLGPVVIGLCALFVRRFWAGVAAIGIATALFAAWEGYLVQTYGESHFLHHVQAQRYAPPDAEEQSFVSRLLGEVARTVEEKATLAGPLCGYLGGLAPALALLGWTALRAGRRVVWGMGFVFGTGFVLIAAVPWQWAVWTVDPKTGYPAFALQPVTWGVNCAILFPALAGTLLYLGFRGWSRGKVRVRASWENWFLALWFWVELAGYFALTPFPAARRLTGIFVVLALLFGRLVSLTCRAPGRRRLVHRVAAFGVGLGLVYGSIDWIDAYPEKQAAEWAAEWVREQPEGGEIYYTGHWGFAFYARREGMRPIWPSETVVPAGSWAVLPAGPFRPYRQSVQVEPDVMELRAAKEWSIPIGVHTNSVFYGGHTPLAHHEGPRVRVEVYRVTGTWKP